MFSNLSFYRIGPHSGPLNLILWLIGSIAFLSALFDPIINYLAQTPGPQDWFALSWYGMNKMYLWEPLSYLFVLYGGYSGISFSFFFSLIFHLSLLYVMASLAVERIGTTSFLFFFLIQGVLAGLLTFLTLLILGQYGAIAGPLAPTVGLLVVWTLFNPESELFILKAKWLTCILLGAFILTSGSLPYLFLTLFGALLGYLYTLFSWNLTSPFPITYKLDHIVNRLGIAYRNRFKRPETNPLFSDDDVFIDAILSKIAKTGVSSLTLSEKNRLDELSIKVKDKNSF